MKFSVCLLQSLGSGATLPSRWVSSMGEDKNIFSKRRQNYLHDDLNWVVSRVTVKLFNEPNWLERVLIFLLFLSQFVFVTKQSFSFGKRAMHSTWRTTRHWIGFCGVEGGQWHGNMNFGANLKGIFFDRRFFRQTRARAGWAHRMRYDRWNVAGKVVTKSLESLSHSFWTSPKARNTFLSLSQPNPHFKGCCQRVVCFERHFCVISRHQMKTRVNSGPQWSHKKRLFEIVFLRARCVHSVSQNLNVFLRDVEEKEIRHGFWRPPKRRPGQPRVINFGRLFGRLSSNWLEL